MSFKFGGGKSSSSTSATENFNRTSTPNVPDWISNLTQDLSGTIRNLASNDASQLVPGLHSLQQQAGASAQELPSGYGFVGGLMDAKAPSVSAESLLTNLDKYMSPYTEDVVDTALADFDYGAGQTRAQQALDLAGSGAFGGSGAAITQSMTEGELNRGRAATSANLRDQAFKTGASLSSEDAARRQAASIANAQFELQNLGRIGDLGLATQASRRADLGTQFDLGEAARQVEGEQRQAPFQLADWAIQALAGLNPNLFIGQTESGTSTQQGTSKGKNSNFGFGFTYGKGG